MSKKAAPDNKRRLTLTVMPGEYAICHLNAHAPMPDWAYVSGGLWATVRTRAGVTLVCPSEAVPVDAMAETGWRALKVKGPFALDEAGVLAALTAPLAEAAVSIFAVSTFETDFLLVRSAQLDLARATLEVAGHRFTRGFSG